MTTTVTRIVLIASACLALSACGDKDAAGSREQASGASGKILDRSITDDMLPYDTVTSQPPRATPTPDREGSATAGPGEAASDTEAADTAQTGGETEDGASSAPADPTPDEG